jgi:hypothetical protein
LIFSKRVLQGATIPAGKTLPISRANSGKDVGDVPSSPMIKQILFLSALLIAPVAHAETMSAAEFDAYTKGKTLFFGRAGETYGAEIYLENRRVRWSFLDGVCKEGSWYEDAGEICFVYEDRSDPQCWSFQKGPRGLIAQFESNPESVDLYEAQDSDDEMICLGPEIGV